MFDMNSYAGNWSELAARLDRSHTIASWSVTAPALAGLTGTAQNSHQQGSHPAHSVDGGGRETNRVLGGYKATLHSTCALRCRGAIAC